VGPDHDEGGEGLRPPADVDPGPLAPVGPSRGTRRGLDAAQRPQPGRRVSGPDEPQGRADVERVRRPWNELGLRRPVGLERGEELGPEAGTSARGCLERPSRSQGDVGTCDFIHDRTADGRPLKRAGRSSRSTHSRLRDEFLERAEFESVADARGEGSWPRRGYNAVRPHSSLGDQAPKEFSAACEREGGRAEVKDSWLMT
jgi:Integrase core domain